MTLKKTLMGTFIVLFFLHLSLVASPRRTISDKVHEISQEDATERWAEFISYRQADNLFFTFELKHSPRKAKESYYRGNMLAKRIDKEYYTRLTFTSSQGEKYDYLFILDEQSGQSQAYSYNFKTSTLEELKGDEISKPLASGLIYTPFDVLMNYKYWKPEYQRAGRITQAVYFYKLISPNEWLGDVEIALSREFNSPVQTQFFAKDGKLLRTFNLGSVKKIDDYWVVKTAEIKDEVTGDKDKFSIDTADLKTYIDINLFKKENMGICLTEKRK